MTPGDRRHGTTAGYYAGCRLDCCRLVRNADERRRRKQREVLGIQRRVDSTGTQRRLRALMALGWTSSDIAHRCGWTTPQAVTELMTTRRFVYLTTAATITEVYDSLSMSLGPSAVGRRRAQAKGWPPPLAWDDDRIDDPSHTVWGWTYRDEPRKKRPALLAELDHNHVGITAACTALGVTRDTLEKWCARRNLTPLYSRLVDREQTRYWANGTAQGGVA